MKDLDQLLDLHEQAVRGLVAATITNPKGGEFATHWEQREVEATRTAIESFVADRVSDARDEGRSEASS